MTDELILSMGSQALNTFLMVAGPLLLIGLSVGLVISIFQATTQIQEQTLSFVPKIIAILVALLVFGPWMMAVLKEFAFGVLANLPEYIR